MRTTLSLLSIALLAGCTQIDTGNVGVGREFGKVSPEPLPPGHYITVLDSVDEVTTKEVSFPVYDLNPKSKDNLTLKDLDVDVYYKTTPAMIPGLYIKYQGDFLQHSDIVENGNDVGVVGYNRVLRAAREATYTAVSKFNATTMHTQRPEIAAEIQKLLQLELDASDKGAFTVTSINVRNLLTDPAIEAAIREQVAADQEVIRKQKEVQIAQAEAERLRAQAQGEADANAILNASLTDRVMQLRMAEIQRDTIIQSAKAGNTIISGNVTPMINAGQ